MNKRDTGIIGEKIACNFLKNNGYLIKETNYRCRAGEIDIIAQFQDNLVFVEERTKKSYLFGTPQESITNLKKEHLRAAAVYYRENHSGLPLTWRIDVIAIQMNSGGHICRVELIENAVEDF
jgi:putative endonuclease